MTVLTPLCSHSPARAPRSTRETRLEALLTDGYVIIDNLIGDDHVEALACALEPWFARTPRCEGDFYGWRTTRIGGLLDKAPRVQDLALHPEILELVEPALSPFCDCIALNLTQGVRVHPGERAQAPHRDEEMWPAAKAGANWLVNVMWAVSDFTPENGATRVWPGSHREALDRAIEPARAAPAAMTRGSALVFLGSLTHGAGANLSAAPRTGVIISYCLGWLKQYENQFLAYAPEIARAFPEPLQRLIGYQIHRPNLGGWEGRDPIEKLQGGAPPGAYVDALPDAIAEELRAYYGGGGPEPR